MPLWLSGTLRSKGLREAQKSASLVCFAEKSEAKRQRGRGREFNPRQRLIFLIHPTCSAEIGSEVIP